MFRAHVLIITIKLIVKQILCIKLVKYWDKYTEMHGQQNAQKMYTNIPTEDLIAIIDTLCRKHNLEDTLIWEILTISRLIISQYDFRFQDKTYLQRNGLAMDAPTSSILSEIYLQYLEKTKIYDILKEARVEGYFTLAYVIILCNKVVVLTYNI